METHICRLKKYVYGDNIIQKIIGDKYNYTVNGSKHLVYMEINRNTYVYIQDVYMEINRNIP